VENLPIILPISRGSRSAQSCKDEQHRNPGRVRFHLATPTIHIRNMLHIYGYNYLLV